MKFAVVGFASLAVEYLFLGYFLNILEMGYLLATTLSFAISIVVNYILSMKFVFSHKEDMSRKREFTIFAILSAIGWASMTCTCSSASACSTWEPWR